MCETVLHLLSGIIKSGGSELICKANDEMDVYSAKMGFSFPNATVTDTFFISYGFLLQGVLEIEQTIKKSGRLPGVPIFFTRPTSME